MTPRSVTVREILAAKQQILGLETLTKATSLDRGASDPDLTSPGLALAGHTTRTPSGRMWVFGETEMTYLAALPDADARGRLAALFSLDVPAVFVTKGQQVSERFLEEANSAGVSVLRCSVSTREFYRHIKPFLQLTLAPTTTLHASLADVYGVGLLFVGDSGVGKSECVLDLVERGHRLVADDLVLASKQGNDVLIGRGHELQKHHMEIRGIGIIDVPALFGVRAIRQQKRIEVIVSLDMWDKRREYSRTGIDDEYEDILGVSIPKVTVPLNPGKNITVISEVVAMNHLLRFTGVNSAQIFDEKLKQSLEQDYE